MRKIIFILFAILLFLVPLVLWPFTSEVFEFNKMIMVYVITILIAVCWTIRSILERKFIFSRTILDIPLLIFLGSQIISTVLSIDFYTSVLGYYSRFNGGLASTICYLVLYWACVSNFDKTELFKLLKNLLISGGIIAILASGEHFKVFTVCAPIQYYQAHNGNSDPDLVKKYRVLNPTEKINYIFRTNCWVQDVQSRVFATLGQPNWLAAWIVALIPLSWAFMLKSKPSSRNFWGYFFLSVLFFWTLIFTKSRSGFLGFGIAFIIFWGITAFKKIKTLSDIVVPGLIVGSSIVGVCIISGTQWTPSLTSFFRQQAEKPTQVAQGTALENGGTESGVIRKIVWNGALQAWSHYPIFGTGVETFAYSYYLYRPIAHNQTSEWDFIYNKAHNEFLNMAANSGTVGLISYLVLIGFSLYQIVQNLQFTKSNLQINSKFENYKNENWEMKIALLAGFISLSVSNFFGFSVVPTQLEFFLFPAFAIALNNSEYIIANSNKQISSLQKISIAFVTIIGCYLLPITYHYWHADILYAKARAENGSSRPDRAFPLLNKAISLEPAQALYYGELATAYSTMAMVYDSQKDASASSELTQLTDVSMQKAVNLAPANVTLHRQMFGIYVRLSTIDEKYLLTARESLLETIKLAPTDAKLYYNLGIVDANLDQTQKAASDFEKAIELKANYADARIQYAALLVHLNRSSEAKTQLQYVLTKIEPGNTIAKTALDNLQ